MENRTFGAGLIAHTENEAFEFFSNIDLPETKTYVMIVRGNYESYKRTYQKENLAAIVKSTSPQRSEISQMNDDQKAECSELPPSAIRDSQLAKNRNAILTGYHTFTFTPFFEAGSKVH